MTARSAVLLRAGLAVVPLALGWALFGSTILDDAHITFVVAERLADMGRVLNNAGEAVEQSSSLLHVLVLGALHRVTGVDVATLGWWVGVLAAGGLVWVTWGVVAEDLGGSVRAAAVAAAVVAVAPGVVVWAVGGLETTLAALVLLLALRTWWRTAERGWDVRGAAACAAATVAVALTRPEAPVVMFAVTMGLGASALWATAGRGLGWRSARSDVAAPLVGLVVGTAAVVVGRLAAFGSALPQPATTKGGAPEAGRGLAYLGRRLLADPGTELLVLGAAVVVVVTVVRRHHRPDVAVLGSAVVAVLGFVVLVGGDWMPGPRLLLPAVAPAAALVAVAADLRAVVVATLLGAQVVGLGLALRADQVGTPVWYRDDAARHAVAERVAEAPWALRTSRIAVRDLALAPALRAVVADVRDTLDRPPTVASYQAGLLASELSSTFGDEVELVDLARLTSRRFDRCDHVLVGSVFGEVVDVRAWLDDEGPPCGVDARPDVFFGLGDGSDDPPVSDGYVVVARTSGQLDEGGRLAGRPLSGQQFVAVRPDLAAAVLDGDPVHVQLSP